MNYLIINIKPGEERKQTLSTGYYKNVYWKHMTTTTVFIASSKYFKQNNTQPPTILLIKIIYCRSDLWVLTNSFFDSLAIM